MTHLDDACPNVDRGRTRMNGLIIGGVAGSGKTTVGRRVAERLGWPFVDGDDLHPADNVAKMRAGRALDEADRLPWLAAIASTIDRSQALRSGGPPGSASARGSSTHGVVIAASVLRRQHRVDLLRDRAGLRIVLLHAEPTCLAQRLRDRQDHFAGPSLLDSQLGTFERPTAGEATRLVPNDGSVEATVDAVLRATTDG